MRFIGLDVDRDWCDVAIYEDGEVRSAGRVATAPEQLELFAQSLGPDDRVALETTGNALSIARIIEPYVAAVLVADTRNVRAMTHAKVKNDRVDARMIAKLLAAGMLPGVWVCDEATRVLRRRIARRTQLVREPTRARNQTSRDADFNLGGRGPRATSSPSRAAHGCGASSCPPMSARRSSAACARPTSLARELAQIDREIARYAVGCAQIRRLMTIPGIDVTTAATLIATIGPIDRFASPRHLVGYLGLDPRSRQSGLGAVQHGHISKQGSATARHVLCEAAHATMRSPGPPTRVRTARPRTTQQQDL